MSMNRNDHHPGRGSDSSPWALKTPVTVTAAAPSQMTPPAARTHGVEPAVSTMTPTMTTTSPAKPTRRAQTAILQ